MGAKQITDWWFPQRLGPQQPILMQMNSGVGWGLKNKGLHQVQVGDSTKKRQVVSSKVGATTTNSRVGWGLNNKGLSQGKVGDSTKKRLVLVCRIGQNTSKQKGRQRTQNGGSNRLVYFVMRMRSNNSPKQLGAKHFVDIQFVDRQYTNTTLSLTNF